MDVQPYTGTAGGTANEGGDIFISNISAFSQFVIYWDSPTTSADTELRCKICTGTNSASSVVGYLSHLQNGVSIETSVWYQTIRSGPDQDGNSHNIRCTYLNRWMFRPYGDLLALGDCVMRINLENKKVAGPNTWGIKPYGYVNGSHPHTDTATGPYEGHGVYNGTITNFNRFLFQVSAGTFNDCL